MVKPQKRLTRRELKQDPLLEGVYRAQHWWQQNRAAAVRYGLFAIVLLVVVYKWSDWRGDKEAAASTAVGIAHIDFGLANYRDVVDLLAPQVEEYAGLSSFEQGLYLLARSELFLGDSAQAEVHYRLFLEEYDADPLIRAGALAGLGIILEGQGDHSQAAELFGRASRSAPTNSMKVRYALYAGRNHLLAGEQVEAAAVLRPFSDRDDLDFQTRNEIEELMAAAGDLTP